MTMSEDRLAVAASHATKLLIELKRNSKLSGPTSGEQPCPACHGTLRWRLRGPKRHIVAACDTPGCIEFQE